MRLYGVLDDITGKKVTPYAEMDNDLEAKRAYALALQNKTGPLAIIAFQSVDYRLMCFGETALDGTITPKAPETVCRMNELTEVK